MALPDLGKSGFWSYRLDLPSDLAKVPDVFHISMLRKCMADLSHVLPEQPITLRDDLAYEEEPVQILDRREQQLRNQSYTIGQSALEESPDRGSNLGT